MKSAVERPTLDSDIDVWLLPLVHPLFAVRDITRDSSRGYVRLRGEFRVASQEAYAQLAPVCRAHGCTLLFRREGQDTSLIVQAGMVRVTSDRLWAPVLLGLATLLSILFSYVISWETTDFSLAGILGNLHKGWAFAASLLGFLLAHELGHYVMARRLGATVSLPYLIPLPFSPLGTMGAVIRMKDVPRDRRTMLLIGAAGPLAGLAVAIPVLLIGLSLSEVGPLPSEGPYSMEGNSLLYLALKLLSFGQVLPGNGLDVNLHPIAFAGWAALLVTSLNLIPAGQLDGGHVAYALLGARARYLAWAVLAVLLALSVWWQGWLLWAALVFFFSRRALLPLDDVSPLSRTEVLLALMLLALFVLTFTPIPLRLVL